MVTKIKKQKISECCNAPMIGGVQCENCGSNGKFSTGTAIVKRMDKIINLLTPHDRDKMPGEEKAVDSKERFIDNGDGTISDTKTKLMWQKEGSQEELNYAQAEEFVAELNKEQYPDWRIPTREELESILDLTKYDPAIDSIFKCKSAGYWSSTPYAYSTSYAWVVYFYLGLVGRFSRNTSYFVRPCRQY